MLFDTFNTTEIPIERNIKTPHRPSGLDTSFSVIVDNFEIGGKAATNSLIAIKRDSIFLASTIAIDKSYRFNDLPLHHGKNKLSVWGFFEDGRSVLIDSIQLEYRSNYVLQLANPVYQVKTDSKVLALTFDAGSASNGADSIIYTLKSRNVVSTIFLTGQFIYRYPDLVLDLMNDGHELANHSYSHPHLTSWAQNNQHISLKHINRTFLQGELLRTDSVYRALTGSSLVKFWRAPFGEFNQEILEWAAEIGYRHINWSPRCDSFDWVTDDTSNIYRTPEELFDHFMDLEAQNALNGAIILMHLNSSRISDHAYQILPKLIDELHRKNYKLVTVSELLNKPYSL